MENIDGQETEVIETEGNEVIDGTDPTLPDVDEPAESGGESVEETEAQPEQEKEDPVQKRINKIHREKMEALERAKAEEQKRAELEAKLQEYQKVEIPQIPELPDSFDPDYEKKMGERDEIIKKHAEEAARQQALTQAETERVEAENRKYQEKVAGYVKAFDASIAAMGLDKESVSKAENVVGKYIGHQPGLAEYLLSDAENGPLNIQYLSQNLEELEKVSKMSPTQAAVHIATKVTPEAQKLKPKQTQAPEPPFDPEGNKRVVDDHPALAGATFE